MNKMKIEEPNPWLPGKPPKTNFVGEYEIVSDDNNFWHRKKTDDSPIYPGDGKQYRIVGHEKWSDKEVYTIRAKSFPQGVYVKNIYVLLDGGPCTLIDIIFLQPLV